MSQSPEQERYHNDPRYVNGLIRTQADRDFSTVIGPNNQITDENARITLQDQLIRDLNQFNNPQNISTVENLQAVQNEATRHIVREVMMRFLRGVAKRIVRYERDRVKERLFEELEGYNLDDATMASLYKLVADYSDPAKSITLDTTTSDPITPFEQDLSDLVKNGNAFNVINQILQSDTILQLLGINRVAMQNKLENIRRINRPLSEAERIRGGKREMSVEDKMKFDAYLDKIQSGFKADTPENIQRRRDIYDYLGSDSVDLEDIAKQHVPPMSVPEFENYIAGILANEGIVPPNHFDEFKRLAAMYRDSGEMERREMRDLNPDIAAELANIRKEDVLFTKLFKRVDVGDKFYYIWNAQADEDLKKSSTKVLNSLFTSIDENPSIEFQDLFSEFHEGGTFRFILNSYSRLSTSQYIRDKLMSATGTPVNADDMRNLVTYDKFYDFVRGKIVQEMRFERNHRELYHNVVTVFNVVTEPEKWAGFFARMNISEFSTITKDPLINAALEVWKTYVQEELLRNGNLVPPNFLGGRYDQQNRQGETLPEPEQIYRFKERKEFIDAITAHVKLVQGRTPERWEVERAFSIARGISAITMELSGILSNAKVPFNYESLPMAPLIGIHNPQFLWGWGRGGREDLMKMAAIYKVPVKIKELKTHFWQTWNQMYEERWIPTEIFKLGGKWEAQLESVETPEDFFNATDKIMGELMGVDSVWFNLLRKMAVGDWFSQGSWRIEPGIQEAYAQSTAHGQYEWGENWDDIYQWFQKEMGVAAGFSTISEKRADDETFRYLLGILQGRSVTYRDEKLMGLETLEIKGSYDINKGRKRDDPILPVVVNGRSEKMSFYDYHYHRLDAIRGRSFFDLLQKDPQAFLNNLGQLMPQLQDGYVTRTRANGTVETIKAADFYFDMDDNHFSEADRDKRNRFLNYIDERFNTPNGQVQNLESLKTIMNFYSRLFDEYGVKTDTGIDVNRKEDARNALFKYLVAAHGKASSGHSQGAAGRAAITPQDICPNDEYAAGTSDAARIRKLMFEGQQGLINHFAELVRGNVNYWGNGAEQIGDMEGFFHRLAYTWFRRDILNVVPNGDLNHYLLFSHVDKSGEDQITRTYGSFGAMRIAQTEGIKVYSRLKAAATSEAADLKGAFEKIMEMHNKVKDLQDWIGVQKMRELQYYIATVVVRYFEPHYGLRLPLPLSGLANLQLLTEKTPTGNLGSSIARLYYGRRSFEMNMEQIKEYVYWLRRDGYINPHGMWSYDALLGNIGMSPDKYWAKMGPDLLIYFWFFIIAEYIKKAFEEQDEGDKKK